MTDDLNRYDLTFTAFEIDHYCDPRDDAEALVELLELRIAEKAAEDCDYCGVSSGCDCHVPISQQEFRAMAARHDEGPARRRQR